MVRVEYGMQVKIRGKCGDRAFKEEMVDGRGERVAAHKGTFLEGG